MIRIQNHHHLLDPVATIGADIDPIFVEAVISLFGVYILYEYLQLRSAETRESRRHHRTRIHQLMVVSALAVFSVSLIIPDNESWPVQVGLIVRELVQVTATEMTPRFEGSGFEARIYQVGLGVYLVLQILIVVGSRVPVLLWNAILGD